MSFGPSKPTMDYGNLWANYSGWLREAKSTFGKSSSTARAKAAAAGITGATPVTSQKTLTSEFEIEIDKLREGATAKELIKFSRRYTTPFTERRRKEGTQFDFEEVTIPAQFTKESPDYDKYAQRFRDYTGVEPKLWEVYLTKHYGLKGQKFSEKELAVFRAESAASGRRTLGGVIEGSQTASPWV